MRSIPQPRADEHLIYERVLPAVPASVTRVRHELDDVLEHRGAPARRREDMMLVLGEAAANVVTHAYLRRGPGPLYVAAALEGDVLVITVADAGRGLVPRTDSPGLGVGIVLMGRLCDELTIEDRRDHGGTHVSALFREALDPSTAASRPRPITAEGTVLHDYVEALHDATVELHADTQAVLAQASQAMHQTAELRRGRREAAARRRRSRGGNGTPVSA